MLRVYYLFDGRVSCINRLLTKLFDFSLINLNDLLITRSYKLRGKRVTVVRLVRNAKLTNLIDINTSADA